MQSDDATEPRRRLAERPASDARQAVPDEPDVARRGDQLVHCAGRKRAKGAPSSCLVILRQLIIVWRFVWCNKEKLNN